MDPTFFNGEYILTSKITYKFRPMKRGDVIVFKSLQNPNIDYIKRIIGLPGDTVTVKGGEVYVNGSMLNEDFLPVKTNVWDTGFIKENTPATIPEGYLFVLGDNRPRSSDSREFGPIPIENVIGTVFYRYFPINRAGIIANPFPKEIQSRLQILFSFPLFDLSHQAA